MVASTHFSRRLQTNFAVLGAVCAICGVLLASSGCDNGMATVTGSVSIDGVPVAAEDQIKGTVTFFPEGGGGVPAVGMMESGGYFEAKAGTNTEIQPGTYLVAIAVNRVDRPADPNELAVPKLLSPAKYKSPQTSELRAEIKPGSNTFDFDLKSGNGKSG